MPCPRVKPCPVPTHRRALSPAISPDDFSPGRPHARRVRLRAWPRTSEHERLPASRNWGQGTWQQGTGNRGQGILRYVPLAASIIRSPSPFATIRPVLIDRFLPEYHFQSRHSISIQARPDRVYTKVRVLDLSQSRLIRWLLRLRGMPARASTLEGLLQLNFTVLGEVEDQELLLGIAGRFWRLRGDLRRIGPEQFREFDREGFAKAVWSFSVAPESSHRTLLSTETRIQCLDEVSRRRFARYWAVIGPFSGWIRREALMTVKRQSESKA